MRLRPTFPCRPPSLRSRASSTRPTSSAWWTELSNWGRWGARRPARGGEPDHARETAGRARAGHRGHHRVARAPRPEGRGRRRAAAVRAQHAGGARRGGEVGVLRRRQRQLPGQLPRLLAQPHRLAVPHPPQGADVQRLFAGHDHRGGVLPRVDRQPAGRHRHPRRPRRRPAPQGGAVSRAGDPDLRGGPRRLGGDGGGHGAAGRRRLHPHRPVGAARRGGPVEHLAERGGAARLDHAVVQVARRLVHGQRRGPRRRAVAGRGRPPAGAPADDRGDGGRPVRQPGPGGAGGDRGVAEPLGVHPRGGAAGGGERHGVAGQRAGDLQDPAPHRCDAAGLPDLRTVFAGSPRATGRVAPADAAGSRHGLSRTVRVGAGITTVVADGRPWRPWAGARGCRRVSGVFEAKDPRGGRR